MGNAVLPAAPCAEVPLLLLVLLLLRRVGLDAEARRPMLLIVLLLLLLPLPSMLEMPALLCAICALKIERRMSPCICRSCAAAAKPLWVAT